MATSTSAGDGGAAAFGFRQPVNSSETAGSRATMGQMSPKRVRDFLLPRVRIVICIAEIPCLNLAGLSLLADSQLKGMAHMMPQILPEVHRKPAQRSRRQLGNSIESALSQLNGSRGGEKRSGCTSDPLENSQAILLGAGIELRSRKIGGIADHGNRGYRSLPGDAKSKKRCGLHLDREYALPGPLIELHFGFA